MKKVYVGMLSAMLLMSVLGMAQESPDAPSGLPSRNMATGGSSVVPPVIQFSDVATGEGGKPLAGRVEITFSLYNDFQEGEPLWSETQNVTLESSGHYSVYLGVTKSDGVPMSMFTSGEAHWLGVQIDGQAEQPRVFLVSVPYAMKAGDATTLGGLPLSAFALAAPSNGSSSTASPTSATPAKSNSAIRPDVSGTGATGFIPVWTNSTGGLGNSAIFQSASRNIGIGTITPAAPLTVQSSSSGNAIYGTATSTSGNTVGVAGTSLSSLGVGVMGLAKSPSGETYGVQGASFSSAGTGVSGEALNTSGVNFGVQGTTESETKGSAGVFGQATAPTGNTVGVKGNSLSPGGAGVFGLASSESGANFGVSGSTRSIGGVGVYAGGDGQSREGAMVHNRPLGAWGDTGATGGAIAVLGTADDGIGMVAANNSLSGYATLGALSNESFNAHFQVFVVQNIPFKGICVIDASGNLGCNGTVSTAVTMADGHKAALYAVEAPENWFEDAGSGKLSNGMATVSLDLAFAETVNAAIEYHVFLTPQGECEGLYVGKKTPQGFEVHELHHGHSDVSFDYRIIAHRKGYEAVRLADVTKQVSPLVLGPSRH
jgi:hypothetical protein